MRLAQFITVNAKEVIAEWEVFASTCLPAASGMPVAELRDHAAGMLEAIAHDLDTPQSAKEQSAKSKGGDDADVGSSAASTAHGTDRAASGYTPEQMFAEFRALRASVLRLWSEDRSEHTRADMQDITRFNEAVDQLLAESIAKYSQDVDHAKDLFLGVLGHDLRNPLGAIMMSATMMLRTEGPDWAHHRTVTRILSSGMRMDGMISELVDFTRTRLGNGIPVDRVDGDLEVLCRHVVDEITAFHPDCVVHLETRGSLAGEWDAPRLGQALSNLVGNAYQHGAPEAAIEVTVEGEAEHVVLSVHNTGPAIAADELGEIFSPFRQLDASRPKSKAAHSLGLGLYITQAIVNAHDGTIEVESDATGTTFKMRLPRRATSTTARKAPRPGRHRMIRRPRRLRARRSQDV